MDYESPEEVYNDIARKYRLNGYYEVLLIHSVIKYFLKKPKNAVDSLYESMNELPYYDLSDDHLQTIQSPFHELIDKLVKINWDEESIIIELSMLKKQILKGGISRLSKKR